MERVQKLVAAAGVCSRRAAEQLIRDGRVRVNGKVVTELGTKAAPTDIIEVDGQRIDPGVKLRYVILHKPVGVVTTRSDPAGRPTVYDLLYDIDRTLHTVGRLDYDSSGLLLLTNDGELTHRLTHPRWGVEKLYRVVTKPWPSEQALRQLRDGVELDDGPARAKQVRHIHADTAEIVLAEGRTRQVRRMFEAVGLEVLLLQRRRFGPLELGELRVGGARPLKIGELKRLRAAVGLEVEPTPRASAARAKPD